MAGGLNEKEVSRCSIQTTGKQKPKGQEDWEDETDFFLWVWCSELGKLKLILENK